MQWTFTRASQNRSRRQKLDVVVLSALSALFGCVGWVDNDSDRRQEKMKNKGTVFVEHIKKHLKQMFPEDTDAKVICKICEKTVDEIYEAYKKEILGESEKKP